MKKEVLLSDTEMAEFTATLRSMKLSRIASLILKEWTKPYFGAVPYITAMMSLDDITKSYGYDSGENVVRYFLGNATTWRGQKAKAVKAELNRRLEELN